MLDFGHHTILEKITRDQGGKSCEHMKILYNFTRVRGRKSSKERGRHWPHEKA